MGATIESKSTEQEQEESTGNTFFTISLNAHKSLQGKEHDNEALMETFNTIALAVCDARSSISVLDALLDDMSQDQKHAPGGIITSSRINKVNFFHAANVTRMCNGHLQAIETCLQKCMTVYDSLILAENARKRVAEAPVLSDDKACKAATIREKAGDMMTNLNHAVSLLEAIEGIAEHQLPEEEKAAAAIESASVSAREWIQKVYDEIDRQFWLLKGSAEAAGGQSCTES